MATLYDKYGGFVTINKFVMAFYGKIVESADLVPYFKGVDVQKLMDHQTKFISSILGGPVEYTGRQMKNAHAHLSVTNDAFSELAELFQETLEDMDVEDADIEIIMEIVNGMRADIVTAGG